MDFQAERTQLQAERAQLQTDRTQLQAERAQLQTDRNQLQADRTQLRTDLNIVQRAYATLDTETRQQINDLTQQINVLTQQNETLNTDERARKIVEQTDIIKAQAIRIWELEQSVENSDDLVDDLRAEIEDSRQRHRREMFDLVERMLPTETAEEELARLDEPFLRLERLYERHDQIKADVYDRAKRAEETLARQKRKISELLNKREREREHDNDDRPGSEQ